MTLKDRQQPKVFLPDSSVTFDPKTFLKNLTTRPGVYQMFNQDGVVIYIGKALNLKKRLASYFQKQTLHPKTLALIKKVAHVEVIITQTEHEALLLEYNLIKKYRPRYNIIFRDDKSYTYIILSDHKYPRLMRQRSRQKIKGHCFGPYPQSTIVREVIDFLQKFFKLRHCKDTFFNSRSRPCLQYQINRCSAPCVNYINEKEYNQDVKHAILFLSGKSDQLVTVLEKKMEKTSENQAYEVAAKYRDQIYGLREIQSKQCVTTDKGDVDVLVVEKKNDIACIYVLMIRQGNTIGNKSFFAKLSTENSCEELLSDFITQYYLDHQSEIPQEILLSSKIKDGELLENAISAEINKKIKLKVPKRGFLLKWMTMAKLSAKEALQAHLLKVSSVRQQLSALQKALNSSKKFKRIECFDVSHTMGEATVASCVVFNQEGSYNQDYRQFNITGIVGGDDVAAMHQVLTRRFAKAKHDEDKMPDLVIIDGGKTQLNQAEKVLKELSIQNIQLIGVAKGEGRKPGLEKIYLSGCGTPILLAFDSPALHLIQYVRDEAHRFAISGHRKRREKIRRRSVLESIEGVGAARRSSLLKHFGGLQGILKASIEELSKVQGVSRALAKRVYDELH